MSHFYNIGNCKLVLIHAIDIILISSYCYLSDIISFCQLSWGVECMIGYFLHRRDWNVGQDNTSNHKTKNTTTLVELVAGLVAWIWFFFVSSFDTPNDRLMCPHMLSTQHASFPSSYLWLFACCVIQWKSGHIRPEPRPFLFVLIGLLLHAAFLNSISTKHHIQWYLLD